MQRYSHGNFKRLFLFIGLLATAWSLPLFFCSKTAETAAKNRFPLITDEKELDTASQKAGAKMVVLDLSADWCMPCKLLEPTLHELSKEFKAKAVFYRVDVDKSYQLAGTFGVRGIPYVVFLKGGKTVYSLTGLNPKENYAKVLGCCSDSSTAEQCADQITKKMQN